MSRHTHAIDWRPELRTLEPYLNGKGGIFKIHYHGESCAPHEFSELLKMRYERKSDNQIWRSIRIDREWHTTRFLDEVLSEFERKLGEFASVAEQDADDRISKVVKVFSENSIEGSVDAEIDLTINYYNKSPSARDRDRRVSKICADLARFLKSGGHMMVVFNHAPASKQSHFWNFLWDRGLKDLVSYGLLLIYLFDHTCKGGVHNPYLPTPDIELHLPNRLEEQREDDAYDDLVEVLQNEIPSLSHDGASSAALAHINSNWQDIKQFHDNLFGLMLRLSQSSSRKEARGDARVSQ